MVVVESRDDGAAKSAIDVTRVRSAALDLDMDGRMRLGLEQKGCYMLYDRTGLTYLHYKTQTEYYVQLHWANQTTSRVKLTWSHLARSTRLAPNAHHQKMQSNCSQSETTVSSTNAQL